MYWIPAVQDVVLGAGGVDWSRLFRPEVFGMMIPLAGMLVGMVAIFAGIVKMIVVHRERMALIEQGLHPDHLTVDEEPAETNPALKATIVPET